MRVTIKMFAAAQALTGAPEAEVELPPGATVNQLRNALAAAYPQLTTLLPRCVFAIDACYATDGDPLPAQGEIACIPPVSGG